MWDGSNLKDIGPYDVAFLTNYDPFNPYGMATKYSAATVTSQILNAPLGVRHQDPWILTSLIIPGPSKTKNLRSHCLILIAEAQMLKEGNISFFDSYLIIKIYIHTH